MSELRQRMLEEMQLRRYSKRTQESYVSWVTQLGQYYGKGPDGLSSEELRAYFVHLTVERKLSRSSVTTALSAVKFLYEGVLKQEWSVIGLVRPRREKKLPVVLSVEEVQRVLNCVQQPRYKVCLSVIYGCGLRLLEGTHLQVADIDSGRMMVHVRSGKGGGPLGERSVRAAAPTDPGTVASVLGDPSRPALALSRQGVGRMDTRRTAPRGHPDGRRRPAEGIQSSSASEWHSEACYGAYFAPLLSGTLWVAPVGSRSQSQADSELFGSQLAFDNGGLHSSDAQW